MKSLCRCGRDYCSAQMVMSAADAMAANGMKEVGYEYIIISGEHTHAHALTILEYIIIMYPFQIAGPTIETLMECL